MIEHGTERQTVECPYCGRTVETMRNPGENLVMFGHHPTMPWEKGDPLCQGSGEEAPGGN